MGDYKSQYENYYSNIKTNSSKVSKGQYSLRSSSNNNKNNDEDVSKNKYLKKLLYQTIGAGVLLLSLFIMKNIPLEGAEEVYIISKETVDKNLELSEAVMAINIPELDGYKEKALDWIDKIKIEISGGKTTKETIKENYIVPVYGDYTELDNKSNAIVISTPQESDVLASYEGTIINIEEVDGSKHITINHGNGIETYYGLLSTAFVSKGDKVEKGQSIGKTGVVNSLNSQGIVFKISYMGIEKRPTELLDFSNMKNV